MHIGDGFLSARVAFGYALLALVGVGVAWRRAAKERRNGPLLGVAAAFIFAAQLVDFPIAAVTSGRLVGSALAAAVLGLPGAVVVMAAVVFVQCFVFADGGVVALGANLFNMALVGSLVGFCCYRVSCGPKPSHARRVAAAALASFFASLAAAASCAEQLALSDAASLSIILPAVLAVHALSSVGEAVITASVVAALLRFRPELLEGPGNPEQTRSSGRSLQAYGLGLALVVAVLLGPIASGSPDGLARVLQSLGFEGAERRWLAAPLADYGVPGLASGALTTVLAGTFGTLLVFGACWLLARALVPRPAKRKPRVRRGRSVSMNRAPPERAALRDAGARDE